MFPQNGFLGEEEAAWILMGFQSFLSWIIRTSLDSSTDFYAAEVENCLSAPLEATGFLPNSSNRGCKRMETVMKRSELMPQVKYTKNKLLMFQTDLPIGDN